MDEKTISPSVCVVCKGRLWCKLEYCPIVIKAEQRVKTQVPVKNLEFTGTSPPSVFVSWKNYPNVTIAPMSPVMVDEKAEFYDAPEQWFGLGMEEILKFREQLVRSITPVKIKDANSPSGIVSKIQELALSTKPVNIEVGLKKAPNFNISFSDTVAPIGPSASLQKLQLQDNPYVHKKVDYVVSDTDLKAGEGMQILYEKKFPMNTLHKLLSAGMLGVGKNRKFVPTRYAITASDSNVSKNLIEEIKKFPEINEFRILNSTYLGNTFYILLLPSSWGFEQIEAWHPGSTWLPGGMEVQMMQDHEFYKGRTSYAENVAGGYYAGRLAVVEYLKKEKRQAAAVVFREISNEYPFSLGVWLVRESIRKALNSGSESFSDLQQALSFISTKLSIPMKYWKEKSKVLDYFSHQKRLRDF